VPGGAIEYYGENLRTELMGGRIIEKTITMVTMINFLR
jgi:hypothetical protein